MKLIANLRGLTPSPCATSAAAWLVLGAHTSMQHLSSMPDSLLANFLADYGAQSYSVFHWY